ncbi:hypothetical protein [Clostridium polynesiense]|uniref:hypothetical protein n=1 Tax=Clostridium polynesiense TaxID=1325933 RepID=UPI0011CC600D|nr:hypothetical protein [Clostridium polynesiense]
MRKSPLSNFKLSDFVDDINKMKYALDEIESLNGLVDRIIIDPSIANLYSIDDTHISNKTGYSSNKIEYIVNTFKRTYMT